MTSCCPGGHRDPSARLFHVQLCGTSQTSFLQQLFSDLASWHATGFRQAHDLQVWYSFSFWFSGEVKHVVHLIRRNSYSRYLPIGAWIDHGPGMAQRTTFRSRNWVLYDFGLWIALIIVLAIILSQWTRGRLLLRHPGLLRHLRRHRQLPGFRTLRPWPLPQDLLCRGWLRHQHTTNYTHNLSPPTPHPFHFILLLHLVTLHTHRNTFLDKLRIFNRDYHLHRHLHPRLHHLHHSLRWQFLHIHHHLHLWLQRLCHHLQNHILPVMTFPITLWHLPSTFHGLQPFSQLPTPSVHQRHLHLLIYTSTSTLLMLLHEPIARVSPKSLHTRHPLLATQQWKQLPQSDRTALQTNLAVHSHRPIHLRLSPSRTRTQCQILRLHPIRPSLQPSPLQLNNFKIQYVSFMLNKPNNNSLCMAPFLHSTNDDLKTNFWLHHTLLRPLRHLHRIPVHLHHIHQRRTYQLPLAPRTPTHLRPPLLMHQLLVFPNPHLHNHRKVLDHARSPRPDLADAIVHPTTVQLSVTDVHALLSSDIAPQPPIQNTDELHHHRDADHLHDIDPHHDIDGLPATALLRIQYIVPAMLTAGPGHLPAILAHPTLYSHLLIAHPIQMTLLILMMMTLGASGTIQAIHLDLLDLFDHLPHGILHVKCLLQKLHQVLPHREYLLGTARTRRWMTHPCHWWTSNRAISNSRRCRRLRQIQHASNVLPSSMPPTLSLSAMKSSVRTRNNSTALWTRCFGDWPNPIPPRMENKCGFEQTKGRSKTLLAPLARPIALTSPTHKKPKDSMSSMRTCWPSQFLRASRSNRSTKMTTQPPIWSTTEQAGTRCQRSWWKIASAQQAGQPMNRGIRPNTLATDSSECQLRSVIIAIWTPMRWSNAPPNYTKLEKDKRHPASWPFVAHQKAPAIKRVGTTKSNGFANSMAYRGAKTVRRPWIPMPQQ